MVYPPDRLGKYPPNIQHLELRTPFLVFLLRYAVRHHDFIQRTGVDAVDGLPAENAVGEQGVDFGCALFFEEFCRTGDGVRGVGEVVDEDGEPVGDVADEHHGRVLAVGDFGGAALLRWGLGKAGIKEFPDFGGIPCELARKACPARPRLQLLVWRHRHQD